MQLGTHLCFNGQCEVAFKFYEQALEGRITFMLAYGDSPAAQTIPAHWKSKVLHATLSVGDIVLAGSDVPPGEYDLRPA